ncbi:MBL fold metallo-hydrolase [Oceanirhabdus sp. W0125-5]|uniref:MBL fold metallo-hydrolase n=1 Tax=Oceanirhabdus sp. W0125-5 TaxID=2999116 RepID=UPI0022F330BD|nr:MBL fold metallo-hydrolase [Oceanirhabdus sp. W0125-5]WBW97444.1 MBL fold metallo-hydrolase [Oceanirhabdus sp. W0125-5]
MRNFKGYLVILVSMLMLFLGGCKLQEVSSVDKSIEGSNIEGKLKIHYIDVGQADAILIEQEGNNMLIDAGNNDDKEVLLSYLKNNGIKRLEYVIGTHPHEDHIGSLDAVIEEFEIGKVLMPKVTHTTKTFKDVVTQTKKKGLKFTTPKIGEVFELGEGKFTVLAPNSTEYKDMNDYSIVIRFEYKQRSFLFTGDAEAHSEEEIIHTGLELRSDVLKAGHHGSSSSSSIEFLKKVKPKYAIISCGKDNDYGHPHKEIIERFNKQGIKMLRTDELGTIVCLSDGESIEFVSKSGVINERDNNSSNEEENDEDEETQRITIEKIDKVKELVYIKNNGNRKVNLKGYRLLSVKGNQEFIFPEVAIEPGEIISISSGDEKGDIEWGKKNMWSNSAEDPGKLFNSDGELISEF